jgi:hypothetical protein
LQGVKGKINQPKPYHPSNHPNLSAVHQKPKENLRESSNHGWIPDPEIYLCIKKKAIKPTQKNENKKKLNPLQRTS